MEGVAELQGDTRGLIIGSVGEITVGGDGFCSTGDRVTPY